MLVAYNNDPQPNPLIREPISYDMYVQKRGNPKNTLFHLTVTEETRVVGLVME